MPNEFFAIDTAILKDPGKEFVQKSDMIQPLDSGDFDMAAFLSALHRFGYRGPVGLQGWSVATEFQIEPAENLRRSMAAWKKFSGQQEPPAAADFSVYHVGNSLTGDLVSEFPNLAAPYEQALGRGYRWGLHFRPATSLTFIYEFPTALKSSSVMAAGDERRAWHAVDTPGFIPWSVALPGNHWDVVTLQPWQDDSNATLKGDTAAINAIIAAARTRPDNASTRFYVYAAWPAVKYGDAGSFRAAFLTPTPDDPDQLGAATRDYFRHVVDSVRKTNPEIAMIPAGEVLHALDEKMKAGKFEHFTSVEQLHRDVIHLNSMGQNVAAWTAYATIFGKSPVGLPNSVHPSKDHPPFRNITEISPADLKLMQETAWEVVSSPDLRRYTGVQ